MKARVVGLKLPIVFAFFRETRQDFIGLVPSGTSCGVVA